ncbi:MAG: alpha/beta hydrolase [Bacteriovorax sp.]|nr:alpha/beta hydrolase [Bacteriovorax sp.]
MKKLIFIVLVLFIQLASAEIALYTADSKSPHSVSEMAGILEKFASENPEKNILFYVHGRNHHMEKEWDKLSVLENSYNVKVVMLHWDAWSSFLSRAVANAEVTAEPLSEAFREIRDFKESHREFFINHKISLLCHSMGNLVLKNFTEKYLDRDQYNIDSPLFENYLGVSADVPLIDHRYWLSRFNLARNKHIIMNNRDIVLLLSYSLDLKDRNPFQYRLGLGFDNYPGKKDQIKGKLVNDVTYIDLSGVLESQHGYFLPKTPVMQNIFFKLSNGERFELNATEKNSLKVNVKVDNNIYYVKDN